MNKVYVVTRGDYSDYHIEAVFPTRDSAERWCAVHWKDNSYDYPIIEEYDLEQPDILDDTKVYYAIFFVYNDKYEKSIYGPSKPSYGIHLGTAPFETDICRNRGESYWKYEGISGYIPIKSEDINEDAALKIIYDHIAKFKAEEAGL